MGVDNDRTANTTAKKLGIMMVLFQVSPETKALEIKMLQDQGKKVIMVGDSMNNAPELIALGCGTHAALSSGHIILMKSNLHQILYALGIGQYCMKKIKQNLSMSFVYNVVTISIAAGLLYGITNSLVLRSALAALG